MPFHQSGDLRFFTFDLFDQYGLVHGFFTRHGGVSPSPWDSLNLGGTVGDVRENVVENRKRIFDVMGRSVSSIFDCWQVHGTDVICTEAPRPLDEPHLKADAILTDRPEITLFMRFADCVPILLFDPVRSVTGMVHAGWRGTLDGVVVKAVERMQSQYGSHPADILAGIGPSVCVDHYEVGPEVIEATRKSFGSDFGLVLKPNHQATHLDLWKANQILLERGGVHQIETAGICTFAQKEDWFSHRGDQGKTGRFGAILAG